MPQRIRPTFENPPVVEVVCGVYFQALGRMQAPHFGLFWETIRHEFPRCASAEPIVMPRIVNGQMMVNFQLGLGPPLPRVWLIDGAETAVVQMQTDCFLYNWKKAADAPTSAYPRYPEVVTKFRKHYESFVRFAEEHDLGVVAPTQLEMTYVNIVDEGESWHGNAELGAVFPDLAWRDGDRYLPPPAAVHWRVRFEMEGGQLEITLNGGRRSDNPEGRQALRFDSVARGPCPDLRAGDAPLWAWFDRANEWIVDGFLDVTSEKFQHDVWRRIV